MPQHCHWSRVIAPDHLGFGLSDAPPVDRVVADTNRPLALYESGFAPRWYVPHGIDRDLTVGEVAVGREP